MSRNQDVTDSATYVPTQDQFTFINRLSVKLWYKTWQWYPSRHCTTSTHEVLYAGKETHYMCMHQELERAHKVCIQTYVDVLTSLLKHSP